MRELKASADGKKIGRLYQQLASCKRQFQDVKMTTEKELLTLKSKKKTDFWSPPLLTCSAALLIWF